MRARCVAAEERVLDLSDSVELVGVGICPNEVTSWNHPSICKEDSSRSKIIKSLSQLLRKNFAAEVETKKPSANNTPSKLSNISNQPKQQHAHVSQLRGTAQYHHLAASPPPHRKAETAFPQPGAAPDKVRTVFERGGSLVVSSD